LALQYGQQCMDRPKQGLRKVRERGLAWVGIRGKRYINLRCDGRGMWS